MQRARMSREMLGLPFVHDDDANPQPAAVQLLFQMMAAGQGEESEYPLPRKLLKSLQIRILANHTTTLDAAFVETVEITADHHNFGEPQLKRRLA